MGLLSVWKAMNFSNLSNRQDKRDSLWFLHLRCIRSYIIMLHKVPSKSGRGLLKSKQIKPLLYLVKRLAKATTSPQKLMCSLSTNNNILVVARPSTRLWQGAWLWSLTFGQEQSLIPWRASPAVAPDGISTTNREYEQELWERSQKWCAGGLQARLYWLRLL